MQARRNFKKSRRLLVVLFVVALFFYFFFFTGSDSSVTDEVFDIGRPFNGEKDESHETHETLESHDDPHGDGEKDFLSADYCERIRPKKIKPCTTTDGTQVVPLDSLNHAICITMKYLVTQQLPEGNWVYEYDWRTGRLTPDNNDVRQAGAFWSYGFIVRNTEDAGYIPYWKKAREFFFGHSKVSSKGGRFIAMGPTAVTTLVTMSYIDYLRSSVSFTDPNRDQYKTELSEFLEFLSSSITPDGTILGSVSSDGVTFGKANPYGDGEILLCLTKASKYLNYPYLDLAVKVAERGHFLYVEFPGRTEKDPALTKGYYQWSSMAWYELSTPAPGYTPPVASLKMKQWVLKQANWIIDDHSILHKERNTGYSFEALSQAYNLALSSGDKKASEKILKTVNLGMCKLFGWQVGNVYANEWVAQADINKLQSSIGGVQNHAKEALLRIDTAQHQLHAYLLYKKFFEEI